MQNTIHIPIHSCSDLITNSSETIFISANQNTVKSIKNLINSILIAACSTAKAEDLFEISLAIEDPDSEEKFSIDSVEGKKIEEECEDDNFGRGPVYYIIVKSKIAAGQPAANILSDLTGLFNIDAWRDG